MIPRCNSTVGGMERLSLICTECKIMRKIIHTTVPSFEALSQCLLHVNAKDTACACRAEDYLLSSVLVKFRACSESHSVP